MKRLTLLFGLLLLVAWPAGAADTPGPKPSTVPGATNAPDQQVIAYYFHGTIRCETCLKIEKQAKETLEQRFREDLDAKRLVFKPVNYELPENTHFLKDFKLPCPSLVLVRRQNGTDGKWTLLGETWQLIEDTVKFDGYVETEVSKFLSDTKPLDAGKSNVTRP